MVTIFCKGTLQISTSPAHSQPRGTSFLLVQRGWLVSVCKARGGEAEKWEWG